MSLVAYGSSDESENEEEESPQVQRPVPKLDFKQHTEQETNKKHLEPPSTENIKSDSKINDSGSIVKSGNSEKASGFFSSIPPPKTIQEVDVLKAEDRPTKKTIVKISVPSLSEFKEDESEPTKKKLKPSAKGSGLFALLPAPRNVFLKGTKSSDGSKTQAPLVPRVVSKPVKTPPVIPKRFLKPDEDNVEDSNANEPQDFFSLGSLNDVPEEVPFDPVGELSSSTLNLPRPASWGNSTSEPQPSSSQDSTEEFVSLDSQKGSADSDFIPVDNGNLQLSEEALQKLCGRRATRQQQELEVIDVSGAALIPDPQEWLTKQLTEERQLPARGFGHRRHDGPTSQQRRKHQITYLAFQAKENELELKNQWSQNRMSRKQTQSKYGF
ncbi:Proline-rich protein PRCC [Gryllus bimaculatus]|nr:Proline-rich protein PRCC [Gryllus bimaculatus]